MPTDTSDDLFSASSPAGQGVSGNAQQTNAPHRITGEVLRLVFSSEDGRHVVIRLLDGKEDEHTLVGPLAGVIEGQNIEAWGHWENHREYGKQFRVESFRALLPKNSEGIKRYLSSGLIPGIGPELAKRMVARFKEDTFHILDHSPDRLHEISGLGEKKLAQIKSSWEKHAQQREIFAFLQSLGIGPALCKTLFQIYGAGTADVVKQNPYRLASDVRGVGFLTADRIAGELGISADNIQRLTAGVGYVLEKLAEEGHVCYPENDLIDKTSDILHVGSDMAAHGLAQAKRNGTVIEEQRFQDTLGTLIYQQGLYAAETALAEALRVLVRHPPRVNERVSAESTYAATLNNKQQQALERAFASTVSIITGGPGVGKTTVVGEIVETAHFLGLSVLLAAPTGRAAKRLAEACGVEAKTIHRLLKWDPSKQGFVHNADHPLRGDMLIVDEVSMLDTMLACRLFTAVAQGTHVVLVGDMDQLPSVGPGTVLRDMIASGFAPVTHLTEIYRQQEKSRIVQNAHAINQGLMPDCSNPSPNENSDFYWIEQADAERVVALIVRLVKDRIPYRFRFDPLNDIQVLTPMNKGPTGAERLNQLLQEELNQNTTEQFQFGEHIYRKGDRVMQTVNNYDKGVFNGDLGRITEVDKASGVFTIFYEIGTVRYEFSEADQIQLAYAITIHKSQGCEFPVVITPIVTQHFIMLQRNLLYTAVSRARQLLVMLGTHKALGIAVRNQQPIQRYTCLKKRLQNASSSQ